MLLLASHHLPQHRTVPNTTTQHTTTPKNTQSSNINMTPTLTDIAIDLTRVRLGVAPAWRAKSKHALNFYINYPKILPSKQVNALLCLYAWAIVKDVPGMQTDLLPVPNANRIHVVDTPAEKASKIAELRAIERLRSKILQDGTKTFREKAYLRELARQRMEVGEAPSVLCGREKITEVEDNNNNYTREFVDWWMGVSDEFVKTRNNRRNGTRLWLDRWLSRW